MVELPPKRPERGQPKTVVDPVRHDEPMEAEAGVGYANVFGKAGRGHDVRIGAAARVRKQDGNGQSR